MLISLESSQTNQPSHNFLVNYSNFELDGENEYEIGLIQGSIWYSWYNISSEFNNNQLRYSADNGSTFNTVTFDDGIYSVNAINDRIANS